MNVNINTLVTRFSFLKNRIIILLMIRKVIIMGNYEITKTLNNNVLICKSNNHEVVLIGKGIGFNKKWE